MLAAAPEQRVLAGGHSPREVGMDKLLIVNEELELVERYVQHDGTPQTAEYEDLASANLIGYFAGDPRASAYNIGQWYWNVRSRRARVVTDLDPLAAGDQKGWIDATLTELILPLQTHPTRHSYPRNEPTRGHEGPYSIRKWSILG